MADRNAICNIMFKSKIQSVVEDYSVSEFNSTISWVPYKNKKMFLKNMS